MSKLACCLALLLASSSASVAFGQQAHNCKVDHSAPTDADNALARREYSKAEQGYEALLQDHPADVRALAGLVLAQLGEGRIDEALALAQKSLAEHPREAPLQNSLADVELRRGEIHEAFQAFTAASEIDPCLARVHFDTSRLLDLSDMHASARKQLDMAHALAPQDPVIDRAWREATSVPLTPEQLRARLEQRVLDPNLNPEQKSAILESIKGIESRQRGDCEPVRELPSATLKLAQISNGPAYPVFAVGLDVLMNGKHKRLELDTGASGLLISRGSAISAGLIPEAEIKTGGLGDRGPADAYVTHVDNIRIGDMEFRNCVVRVLEKRSALDVDGLIGSDVFRNYLVTIDTPSRELRLAPLPSLPDQAPKPAGLATGGEGETQSNTGTGAEPRPAPRDRYIPPEMKDWARVYGIGHYLIVPTYLVLSTGVSSGPPKLFILDTGAATPLISPAAAREVTHVESNDRMHIHGISGEVKDVKQADDLTIQFAGVRQRMVGTTSIDTSGISKNVGLEISGFIAFPTLSELILTIDYRDDLLHAVYDPNHGLHIRR